MVFNLKYKISNLINNVDYYILKISLLLIKKVKLYKILKKINAFIYRLKLLLNIFKIYLIILVIHLK